jgi:hypothetical protein
VHRDIDFARCQSTLDFAREKPFSPRSRVDDLRGTLVTAGRDNFYSDLQIGPGTLQRFDYQRGLRTSKFAPAGTQNNLPGPRPLIVERIFL